MRTPRRTSRPGRKPRTQAERYDEERRSRASAPSKPRRPAARPTVTASARRRSPRSGVLLDARGRVENAEREAALSQEELARALSVHRDCTAEVTGARSRLIDRGAGDRSRTRPGTRAIVDAWQREELRGIEGIVSNLIRRRAVRARDGRRVRRTPLQRRHAHLGRPERAIEFLNRKESGRATFCRSTRWRIAKDASFGRICAARQASLATRIRWSKRGRSTAASSTSWWRHADRRSALDRNRPRTRTRLARHVVTLTGQQITGGSTIRGGRFQHERSMLSRRVQAQTLREALVDLRPIARERRHAARRARSH